MLRILHLVRSLRVGGLEQVVIDLANGLAARGIECHLGCLVEKGEWIGRAKVQGVWVGDVDHRTKPAVILDLCRYLRKNRINLVHSHNAQAHIFGAAASILTGIPLVHTKHGRNFPDVPRWVWLSRQLARFTRKIVAVSGQVAQVAVAVERVPAEKVVVIANGVDVDRFKPGARVGCPAEECAIPKVGSPGLLRSRSREFDRKPPDMEAIYTRKAVRNLLGVRYPEATGAAFAGTREPVSIDKFRSSLAPGTFVVGTVGRIVPEKNYPMLVRAFAKLHRSVPASRLVIVGDGPNAAEVEKAISDADMQDACTITGIQRDPLPWFGCMDVFCLSSWTEGTSITLLEAGSCGLPAIVTGVGSNADIVADGLTGIVIPSGDAEALAGAMAALQADGNLRAGLGRQARARIEEHYSVSRMVDKYEALYREQMHE